MLNPHSSFLVSLSHSELVKMSRLVAAAAAMLMMIGTGVNAQAPDPAASAKPLDESFPEKVLAFPRSAVKKIPPTGQASDSAEAKYTAGSGEITWTATAFATPEKAMEALTGKLETLKKDGGKVATGIKNAEGKVRFAAVQTKQGPTYCWVNKKQKNLVYVVMGKTPDVTNFVEAQTTW